MKKTLIYLSLGIGAAICITLAIMDNTIGLENKQPLMKGLDPVVMEKHSTTTPSDLTQDPLPEEKSDMAFVFIGGFGDEESGNMRRCYDALPEAIKTLPAELREQKIISGFYHWEGDEGNLLRHDTKDIQDNLNDWLKINPSSTLIIIGHSYGGSASMDVARHLDQSIKPNLYVVTLDPVSRRPKSKPRHRSENCVYWVNSYIHARRSIDELTPVIGGAWKNCEEADVNVSFSGKTKDFTNKDKHLHARSIPLLFEHGENMPSCAWEELVKALVKQHSSK